MVDLFVEPKYCINCEYYINNKCYNLNNTYFNLVDGEKIPKFSAKYLRRPWYETIVYGLCGPKGKWFKRRE